MVQWIEILKDVVKECMHFACGMNVNLWGQGKLVVSRIMSPQTLYICPKTWDIYPKNLYIC